MRRGTITRAAIVAALLWIGGCTPGGGGGGGDCREADDACSAGFVCVAVGGGSNYACRAACEDDGDCLRDEQCIDGLCADRPRGEGDAEASSPVALDQSAGEDPIDAEVDRGRIQIIDAGPEPDMRPEPDAGPPEPDEGIVMLPGACEGTFDPSGRWLLGVALDFAPDSPIYFQVEIEAAGDRASMDVTPLRVGTRALLERGLTGLFDAPLSPEGRITGRLPLYSPAEGNRFGGGDVFFELDLNVQLRPPNIVCGVVDGQLNEPGPRALEGAIVSMVRWREPVTDLRPFVACEDCLP